MIHLDTSILVDALTGSRRSAPDLRRTIEDRERLGISTLVLYEWLRGPRRPEEVAAQEALFPRAALVPFEAEEGRVAAQLYRGLRRARGREVDLAVAACALTHRAAFWTLNRQDFRDIPGLTLYTPGDR